MIRGFAVCLLFSASAWAEVEPVSLVEPSHPPDLTEFTQTMQEAQPISYESPMESSPSIGAYSNLSLQNSETISVPDSEISSEE